MMFKGAGFRVVDLGIDVPEERFIEAIREHKPDILGLSALLSMTLPMMQSTMNVVRQSRLQYSLKVMVGGAPVTERFAREIGADGYAPDAASAVEKARDLLKV
jgi:5-methyltetrahydrofolate--homocysteine methyltransferase